MHRPAARTHGVQGEGRGRAFRPILLQVKSAQQCLDSDSARGDSVAKRQ